MEIAAFLAGVLAKKLIKNKHISFAFKQFKESCNPAFIKRYLLGLFDRWV
jgi:hypothetical protein